jgi:hypothetical protein
MKERRAIALAERHRADLQPCHAIGPKGIAVERRVIAGPGKRWHHIGERAERAASEVQHAARKTFRRESPPRGFQQRQPGRKVGGECPTASLDPLDAFGDRRAGLDDASHHPPDDLEVSSSKPRASSSSRTKRFGTLP